MKNIHVLPTDNPSRLGTHRDYKFHLHNSPLTKNLPHFCSYYIYITCDEEIKDEEWHLHYYKGDPGISKSHNGASEFINLKAKEFGYNKIILTTDPSLIAEGVQAIDDEFLMWFVNHPSCEYVEVDNSSVVKEHIFDGSNDGEVIWEYKIIIPQEAQGYICPQTKKQCDDECCVSTEDCHIEQSIGVISDCEPEQETNESFENKSLKWWMSLSIDEQVKIGFKYDEPTFNLTIRHIMSEFEQFKKK